jgi:glycosyltransferase involved in cell wall biosynthesis
MISVIIPAYNEEQAIAGTVDACVKALAQLGGEYEIIVVDDGSSDNTSGVAVAAGARIIRHPHNLGYGRSLKDGILAATYDTIVIADADGTYPVDRIPDLFRAHLAGFHMVVGARQGKHYDESFGKKMLRVLLKALVEFTAGRKIPDINSGLRIFSRQDILPYFQYLCETFSFTTSLTLAYMMNGMFVTYIPIEYQKRVGMTKVRLFRDSLRTLQFIVEAILYYNPIKIFLAFSVCLIGLASVCFLDAIVLGHHSAFLLGVGCVVLSVLMFGIGLVSIQLKQLLHLQDTERTAPNRAAK